MTDLNIVALKRKAGCVDDCSLSYTFDPDTDDPIVVHNGHLRRVDTTEPGWVNGVIEWLRGLKHE